MAIFSDLELERLMNEAGIPEDRKASAVIKKTAGKVKDTAKDRVNDIGDNMKKNSKDIWIAKKMQDRKKAAGIKEDGMQTITFVTNENGELEGYFEESSDDFKKKVNDVSDKMDDAKVDLKVGIEKGRQSVENKIDKEKSEWKNKPAEKTLTTAVDFATGSPIRTVGMTAASRIGNAIDKRFLGKAGNKAWEKIKEKHKNEDKKVKKEEADLIYRYPEFSKAVNECFDITDRDTRRILLAVNEADQNKVLVSLTSKLYDSVVNKVDDIDFGTIPASKGDITKLSNYQIMVDCLANIRALLVEFKQDTHPVDVITGAIACIAEDTDIWTKAYSLNVELPMVTYNTIVLAIIEATSYLVSMCVEFVKSPSQDTMKIMIDKSALTRSKQHLTFKSLESFNDASAKGQVRKAMEHVIHENSAKKNFVGIAGVGVGAAIVGIAGLLFIIIPIIRELIFLFYYYRVRASEFCDVQADMLQISSYNVQNNRLDLTKEERRNISSKQMKCAERFRKVAKKIEISGKAAEHSANDEVKAESNKKYKAEEVLDELPDSASSALF